MKTHEAGPELDRLIAETVMKWSIYHYDKGGPGDEYWSLLDDQANPVLPPGWRVHQDGEFDSEAQAFAWFRPSTDMLQAWQVVEAFIGRGRGPTLYTPHSETDEGLSHGTTYACSIPGTQVVNGPDPWDYETVGEGYGVADTGPLAICRAAFASTRPPWKPNDEK